MSIDNLMAAILAMRSQVDFIWQFFVTVHIALFALLLIYDDAVEALNVVARAFAIVGVAVFDWVNGHALRQSYLLLDAFHEQLRLQYGQVDKYVPALYERFVLASFIDRPSLIYLTHSMAFTVVVMAIVWRGFISHSPGAERRQPRD